MRNCLTFIFLLFIQTAYAQLCGGTRRIVWKDDFGAGVPQGAGPNGNINNTYLYQNFGVGIGNYFIANKFSNYSDWHKIPEDHTPGDNGGYFLIIDGLKSAPSFYSTIVSNICPNTNYTFSAWAMNMDHPEYPSSTSFIFKVTDLNDNPISEINTDVIPVTNDPTWVNFGLTFNSGNNVNLKLSIVFNSFGYDDFAFDDFEFSVCGPALKLTSNVICNKVDLKAVVASYPKPVYTWYRQNGSGWSVIQNANAALYTDVNATSSWYKVRVSDISSACAYIEDSLEIIIPPSDVVINVSNDTTICKGQSIILTATGADNYDWVSGEKNNSIRVAPTITTNYIVTGNNGGCPSLPKTIIVTVNAENHTSEHKVVCAGESYKGYITTGKYNEILTGYNGCDSIHEINLTVYPLPDVRVGDDLSICVGKPVQLKATGAAMYKWTPSNYINDSSIATPILIPVKAINYIVTGVDINGCSNKDTLVVTIDSTLTIKASKSNDVDCSNGTATLSVTGADQYEWSPSTGLNNVNSQNPKATPFATQTYTVKGTDDRGCFAYDSVTIFTNFSVPRSGYYIPSAFTPNNDGLNDCFGIKNWGGISYFSFSIYNRWGQLVFHTQNPSDCWDGRYKGQQVNVGNFSFVIHATTACGEVYKQGNVVLIR